MKTFLKWWTDNGKLGQEPAWLLLKEQGLSGKYKRENVRKWIKENGGGVLKKHKRPCLPENILKDLEKGIDIGVCDKEIQDLINQGYNITTIDDRYYLEKDILPLENNYNNNWGGDKILKFGIVSDTHLCNKFQQLTFLHYLYDVFRQEGIDTVYHSGDLTDGDIRRNKYELFKYGADDQSDYVIKNYPQRTGMKTRFITGNHDHWHIQNGGIDIGKIIAYSRPDMEYLGCANATINLTPNCKMELNHPLDGASYAVSYSIQKYMDSMSGGEKPNILINGHHHKALYTFYRNIHSLEAGTTEAQTPFMKGKRIAANICGWIVEVRVNSEGTITRFSPTLIPQYQSIKNDY